MKRVKDKEIFKENKERERESEREKERYEETRKERDDSKRQIKISVTKVERIRDALRIMD